MLIASVAGACAREPSPSERRADTPHPVTLIGCIERGGKEGDVILRGRDVAGTTGTGVGEEAGGIPSTAAMRGGDEDRNARPGTPIEARASTLTPRLESADSASLAARVGQRALVSGDFEPADIGHPYDRVKVTSIETVSPSCSQP